MADDLPCADLGLLVQVKRSPQYRSIRQRVARPKPVDAWQVDMKHYFFFDLRAPTDTSAAGRPPIAMFVMSYEADGPVMAAIIDLDVDGEPKRVTAL